MKNTSNHITMNMIGLAHITQKILMGGDILISLVVLIAPKALRPSVYTKNSSQSGSNYPHSMRRLMQYVYDRILSSIVKQVIDPVFYQVYDENTARSILKQLHCHPKFHCE